jgi:hypothetical protein
MSRFPLYAEERGARLLQAYTQAIATLGGTGCRERSSTPELKAMAGRTRCSRVAAERERSPDPGGSHLTRSYKAAMTSKYTRSAATSARVLRPRRSSPSRMPGMHSERSGPETGLSSATPRWPGRTPGGRRVVRLAQFMTCVPPISRIQLALLLLELLEDLSVVPFHFGRDMPNIDRAEETQNSNIKGRRTRCCAPVGC